MKKYFIITIDTEGDSLWNNDDHNTTTDNAKYIPRFQLLCEKYNFIPTWLTTYEMIQDDFYVNYMKKCIEKGTCEIGSHLHPWDTPPSYEVKNTNELNHPFVTQYPDKIVLEKLIILTETIKEKLNISPTSHRVGRWVLNERYLSMLAQVGYKVDCSITPYVNWIDAIHDKNAVSYENCNGDIKIKKYDDGKELYEIPMTICRMHNFHVFDKGLSIKNRLRNVRDFIKGKNVWLRPSITSLEDMIKIVDMIDKSENQYIMFMIHSSELMPGGSPYYKNEQDIESLYCVLNNLFSYIKNKEFIGIGISDFVDIIAKNNE